MGCSESSQNYSSESCDTFESAKQRATKVYNYRIKNYNPIIHGPIEFYIIQIEAEYELECIPEYMRRGRTYYN
jgi:hypothetical protein